MIYFFVSNISSYQFTYNESKKKDESFELFKIKLQEIIYNFQGLESCELQSRIWIGVHFKTVNLTTSQLKSKVLLT